MKRILILGGTSWLGRTLSEQLLQAGNDVTVVARGVSGHPAPGAHFIRADRLKPGAYDAVSGRFDQIVELAYEPQMVQSALEALSERCTQWVLVSTISVYAAPYAPGHDHDAPLVEPIDLSRYADAKAAAEQTSRRALGAKLRIIRPGLIAGPGDPSDRFGYWMSRLARSGAVLVPQDLTRPVQCVDVRDVAAAIVQGELPPIMDAVAAPITWEHMLQVAAELAGHHDSVIPVDDQWLVEHAVNYWSGPKSLPLWLPAEDRHMLNRSSSLFAAHARGLEHTIAATLQDEIARGLDRPRAAGLSMEEERELLSLLSSDE